MKNLTWQNPGQLFVAQELINKVKSKCCGIKGTLSVEVQAMLLRVLQEGTYIPIGSNREKRADVRIVAATNEDLQLAIQEKRFREDLYHRLCEFEIVMPSLHECPEDILPLANHFRKNFPEN